MNLSKLQRVVLNAISINPDCANDDAKLQATVWGASWNYDLSLYENLKRVPRAESLSRRRRELYNLGLITYSDEKLAEREEAFKNELEHASDNKAVSIRVPLERMLGKQHIFPNSATHDIFCWCVKENEWSEL